MSGLTPEAARAAAAAYGAVFGGGGAVSDWFRAEADRLENAAKTPGQVLAEASGCYWADLDQYATDMYADRAAAVIAHHVGPDRVVVDREDLATGLRYLEGHGATGPAVRNLREALS